MIRRRLALLLPLCCLVLAPTSAPARAQDQGSAEPAVHRYPAEDVGVRTLEARKTAQLRTRGLFRVPIDFAFTDQQPTSGIDFVHESVDDSLRTWKPAHYDHGNGILVADVDGDQRLDLYFLTQIGSNRLYRNLGDGRFEEMTEGSGVGLADRVSVTGAFGDYDNDGDPDLFVTTVRMGNVLFENDGSGHFQDATKRAGVGYSGHSSGAVWFDFDLDGDLDLFVTNVGDYTLDEQGRGGFYRARDDAFEGHLYPERTEKSLLYRNLGEGLFTEVSAELGLEVTAWSGDATFTDFNGDLYPDLYVLNMQGDDHYYENQGGKRFVDRTDELFGMTSWGAMGVKFFDYDNDLDLDLYITDMHSDMHDEPVDPLRDEKIKYSLEVEGNISGNTFFRQGADGTFTEVSDAIGVENFWPWGLSAGDLNADGYTDLFVASSMNFPFRYGVNSVLMNNGGTNFLDAEFLLGVEPRRDGRTHKELFTLHCDGEDAEHPVCKAGLTGTATISGTLGTRTSAILDLEGDGDLDIVTGEFNDVPQVLVSDLAQRGPVNWLEIDLTGTRSNRDGLGSRVVVRAGDDAWLAYSEGKSGYLSQSSEPLYFGLGAHTSVDSIEVLWPSGTKQTISEGLEIRRRIEIVEPAQ